MTTTYDALPARSDPPTEIVVQPPPRLPDEPAGDALTTLVPMLGTVGSVAVMATLSTGAGGQVRVLAAAGLFLAATLGVAAAQFDRQRMRRRSAVTVARSSYLRHLGEVRRRAREAGSHQRAALLALHPPPTALPALASEGTRVWERNAAHPAFLQVRYAVSEVALTPRMVAPQEPHDDVDLVAQARLRSLLAVHATVPEVPVAADLRALDRIELSGTDEEMRALARALICSAAALHAPDHLMVAVFSSSEAVHRWDWLKWLPHAGSPDRTDAVGPRRLVAVDPDALLALLPSRTAPGSHLLLVVDGEADLPERIPGASIVDLSGHVASSEPARTLRLECARSDRSTSARADGPHPRHDSCDVATAEALARRLSARGILPSRSRPAGLMELWGFEDVDRYDPSSVWRGRSAREHLRVPIGIGPDGPIHLDLKESARDGIGPHGLLVGATGSGKSELLRTLVLGLALTHPPERLNLVLVDFKGGATFSPMSALPHVAGLITNLAAELPLVDRVQEALSGELRRRQELLRRSGGFASAHDYAHARTLGADLEPLPCLVIVVDEFAELLAAKPDFLDVFLAIGRLGRSLGMHLLIASQRLEEGRLRGLESHLSYRIALRTFSEHESRAVLGVPDAHELPARPGVGLLRADPTTLMPFTAAYVSGPASAREPPAHPSSATTTDLLPWTVADVAEAAQVSAQPVRSGPEQTLLDAAVTRLRDTGPRARQIWLPPLTTPSTLGALLGETTVEPRLGLTSRRWRSPGRLRIPLGVVDLPCDQRRETLMVDLAAAGGHLAVVGGPSTGKSTVLRTLVAGLSLTTTPLECQVYVLDFGGGTGAALRGLPHLVGNASRTEPDVVRRIVAEVDTLLDRREAYFREHGIDSMDSYRRRRLPRTTDRSDDGYGDVVVVADGWGALRHEHPDLEAALQALAARGSTYGVHLVVAASRWADLRPSVRDLIGTRLELRLGDPVDSEIDRRQAAAVPADRPGRGLTADGHHLLTALPCLDPNPPSHSPGDSLADLVARVSQAWTGPPGPTLRMLPEHLTADDLLARFDRETPGLLLGVREKDLGPVALDPHVEPHWLVFGEPGSGKSAALRGYVHEVMRTHGPGRAQLVVLDYRRALLGEVPDHYLLHYLTSGSQAEPALLDLANHLHQRLPGPAVTADQLRTRSWWSGAEAFVVVDDYDLVAGTQSSPLQPLVPLLARAHDVGLHLVVARRTGGAARALYEPVIQALRDLATPGLVLSGSPEEGPLVGGVHPRPARPGRGRLVTRDRGVEVLQVAWRHPAP